MPKQQQRMTQPKSKLLHPPPPPPPQLHHPVPMVLDRCLHCDQPSRDIQVRCDECGNFICTNCHWCHEFQGNHEIRVCGYCDGFYCKDCDEMDQCDDCQETVCGNCSTLLTCKFCGGGLCEECATACGRCGIVLCRRDAKFAVECDTCRMSYCLVCLAGTPKDPCVRCGQRPTKRMEQLVHLRLKSIYKAFNTAKTDQSAANQLAQEKADAAAAELLAEIEQEEEAKECKKNTKKKKKKKPDTPISLHNHHDIHCRDLRRDRNRHYFAEQDILEQSGHAKEPSIIEPLMTSAVDPLEEELAALVNANDSQGLERLLTSVKGVPGRAAFRKNAKKALKKMRSLSDEPADEEPLELFMVEESPKLNGSLRPDEMLRLISDSKRSRGGYECVMYMAPSIVGWVIGKGGQRIRDMMDESGARIWIDQDSMNANAPRIVYVSGQRDNVDTAISAIQELIAAAPAMASPRTPIPAAGVSDAGLSSAPAIPDATNVESPPSLKPRCKAKLTCAPRFVPLLIGKRGWTIKKIQDTTGAKVDIDQTASPRQITISGREDAVDEAKLMVEDVLNYPHAYPLETDTRQQELDFIPEAERLERSLKAPSTPTESPPTESLVPSSATPPQSPTRTSPVVIETTPNPVQRHVAEKSTPFSLPRRFASPPSSLIMTGDVKSTVSASSSLSSTPEPKSTKTVAASTVNPPSGFNMNSPMVGAGGSPAIYHGCSQYPAQIPFMGSPHISPRMTNFASSPPPPVFGNIPPRGGYPIHPPSVMPPYMPPHGPYVPPPTPIGHPMQQPIWHVGHAPPLPPPPHMVALPPTQQSPYYAPPPPPESMIMRQSTISSIPGSVGMLNGQMDQLGAEKNLSGDFISPPLNSSVFTNCPSSSSRDDAKVVESLFGSDDYSTKELIMSGLKGLGLGCSEPDLMTGLWGATTAPESLFSTGDARLPWEHDAE